MRGVRHLLFYFSSIFSSLRLEGKNLKLINLYMSNQEPPIYRSAYELTLSISRFVKDCHASYKLTLGHLLQKEVLQMEATIYHANDQADKALALQTALDSCYFIRIIVRLFLDLNIMKLETNIDLNLKIDETARQLAGWKKSLQ